jgi:hypothetical protein
MRTLRQRDIKAAAHAWRVRAPVEGALFAGESLADHTGVLVNLKSGRTTGKEMSDDVANAQGRWWPKKVKAYTGAAVQRQHYARCAAGRGGRGGVRREGGTKHTRTTAACPSLIDEVIYQRIGDKGRGRRHTINAPRVLS